MANRSKAKGTAHETAIVRALNENGWPKVERRTLSGAHDRGDIAGLPVVVEAKAHQTYAFPEWIREAEVEAANAGVEIGVVWAKRNGKTSALDGIVAMSGHTFLLVLEKLRELEHLQGRA